MAFSAGREEPFGIEIHQVRYLLAVSEISNFTRNGQMQRLSTRLDAFRRKLEEELGGLLTRKSRKTSRCDNWPAELAAV
jgi:hypothetical protein